MKHRAGLLVLPGIAVAAAAFLPAAAHAATTFTVSVSPGGAWSGTTGGAGAASRPIMPFPDGTPVIRDAVPFPADPPIVRDGSPAPASTVGIRDAVSNQVTLCAGLAVRGSFKSGAHLSGTGIGALTSIAFTGCKVEGVTVTVTVHTSAANPAPINLTAEFPAKSATFTGQATNVSLTLDDANGCHAEVGANPLSGGGPGFAGIAYRSTDARLSFAAGGKGLFVQSATPQCNTGTAGLDVKQFDRIDLGGFGDSILDSSVIISPPQKMSTP